MVGTLVTHVHIAVAERVSKDVAVGLAVYGYAKLYCINFHRHLFNIRAYYKE